MDIRANSHDLKKLRRITKHPAIAATTVLNLDETRDEPALMTQVPDASGELVLQRFASGFAAAAAYLRHGYDRIVRFCPLIKRRCVGPKCQWYVINGSSHETRTGDCVVNWQLWKR